MKLIEVLQPLLESSTKIKKITEKYATRLVIIVITEELHRGDEQTKEFVSSLDEEMRGAALQLGQDVFDDYEEETGKDQLFINAIKKVLESEHYEKVLIELEPFVAYIAENFDPTPNNKYLEWLIRIYTKYALVEDKDYNSPDFILEDNELVNDVLSVFHQQKKYLDKSDINQYKSFTELKKAVDPFMGEIDDEKKQEMIGSGQAEVIYESNDERVIIPRTLKAAKVFSKGTEWCTQYPNMFNEYTSQGPIYIIDTPDPDDRIQLHVESNQLMDVDDKAVYLSTDETHSRALDWLIEKIKEEAEPNKALFLLKHGLITLDSFLDIMLEGMGGMHDIDIPKTTLRGLGLNLIPKTTKTEEAKNKVIEIFKSTPSITYGFGMLSSAYHEHGVVRNPLGMNFEEYVKIANEFLDEADPQDEKIIANRFSDTVNEIIERGKLAPNKAINAFKYSVMSDKMKVHGATSLLQTILRVTSPAGSDSSGSIAPDWYVELVKQEGPTSLSNKRILGIITEEQFIDGLNDLPDSNDKQDTIQWWLNQKDEREKHELLSRLEQ